MSRNYTTEVIGPCYSTDALLAEGISLEEQEQMVKDHRLLCLVSEDGVPAYPLWQFKPGTLEPVDCLPAVLTELEKGLKDSWAWALWLIQPNRVPRWETEPLDILINEARTDVLRWTSHRRDTD